MRLDGSKKRNPPRIPRDLVPQWGEINPETEDPDDIMALFEEWHKCQAARANLINGGRITKSAAKKSHKSYPQEYKLNALTLWQVGVVIKEPKKGSPIQRPEWEHISRTCAAKMLGICPKQLRE